MDVGLPFHRRDHRHANVREVLQGLDAFIMDLAPNIRIGDIAEGRKIDSRNEVPGSAGQENRFPTPPWKSPPAIPAVRSRSL
jgi:hypothetical protein